MKLGLMLTMIGSMSLVHPGMASAQTSTSGGNMPMTLTGPDTIAAGSSGLVTVTVVNNTTGVVTSEDLGIQFASNSVQSFSVSSPNAGATCANGDTRGVNAAPQCILSELLPGASFVVNVTVVPNGSGPAIQIFGFDNRNSGSPTITVAVAPGATDLQITGTALPGQPQRGITYRYQFLVKNNGNFAANNVTFSSTIPSVATLQVDQADPSGTCTINGNVAACSLGTIAHGQQVRVTLWVLAPNAPATYTTTGQATMDNVDTQPGNNQVGVTVQVR